MLTQKLHAIPRLCRLLIDATACVRASWVEVTFGFEVLLLVLRVRQLDVGRASLDQDRMAADVLPLHLLRGLEVVVAVAETHKAIAFALRSPFVTNYSSLLH